MINDKKLPLFCCKKLVRIKFLGLLRGKKKIINDNNSF